MLGQPVKPKLPQVVWKLRKTGHLGVKKPLVKPTHTIHLHSPRETLPISTVFPNIWRKALKPALAFGRVDQCYRGVVSERRMVIT